MTKFNLEPNELEAPLTVEQAALDQRLTRALESAPDFAIPAGFAARTAALAANLPASAETAVRSAARVPRFSNLAIQLALALLIVAMLLFVPSVQLQSHATLPEAIEILLALEFGTLFTWFSLRPAR